VTQVASNARTVLRRAARPSTALALVLLLSFALRIAALTTNPPELFEDELAPAASASAWLVRVLGRRPWEGVVAAFVFAVTPWAVHYGRIGWEPASTLPFTIGGIGLLWDGLARRRPRRVAAAAVILVLGAYAYTPALLTNVLLLA
jgi:hypothetical protein